MSNNWIIPEDQRKLETESRLSRQLVTGRRTYCFKKWKSFHIPAGTSTTSYETSRKGSKTRLHYCAPREKEKKIRTKDAAMQQLRGLPCDE